MTRHAGGPLRPLYGTTGPYTLGPPTLRARALLCALTPRQRQLVLGFAPWSAQDKPGWNQPHYRRAAQNLVSRIRAAGVEAHFLREHVRRPETTGATHRLVLMLGPRVGEWPCECHAREEAII